MPDNRPCHCGRLTQCPNCWLAANSVPHRKQWGIEDDIPPPPKQRGPCVHLGVVIEFCTGCQGEARHVRQCFHDDNPTEKCTLGVVSDQVWSCATCPNHSEI